DRGVEEVVQAMQFVENAVLLIIGSGDVLDILKGMVKEMNLHNKVKFIAKVPFEELAKYTAICDVGLTVDKDTNMNYRYSLPNKIFNYVQAGIAVLASDLVEVARVVREYNVGVIIKNHNPEHIADVINELIGDEEKLNVLKKNSMLAAKELTWENEEKKLKEIFSGF
ncbi:MAG: glycosyltransferase, partial [Bacteroidia bacterium]|nr:glycosyltransferase [Bacteroidia bacterium]